MKRFLLVALLCIPMAGLAADGEYVLVIRNHQFQPAELAVPANQKVRLLVDNQDATPEEFESHELNREKVIGGNSKVIIYIGPLAAGRYPYYGEFHAETARGVIVAQ